MFPHCYASSSPQSLNLSLHSPSPSLLLSSATKMNFSSTKMVRIFTTKKMNENHKGKVI